MRRRERYLDELLRPENTSYRPRAEVEKDPGFKQLIPYVIFRHVDAAGTETRFSVHPRHGQGEGRLHSKRSVGIGGHISAIDAVGNGGGNPYEEGMRRELDEEVSIDAPYTARCVGLINDDQTEVGTRSPGSGLFVRRGAAGRAAARDGDHRVRFSARRRHTGRHDRVRDLVADLHQGPVWGRVGSGQWAVCCPVAENGKRGGQHPPLAGTLAFGRWRSTID